MRLLLAAASGFLLAACADPAPPTLSVRADYLGPLYDGQAMRTDHEAIPDRMPAMRMPFRVADPAILDGVDLGPVQLTLDSASLVVLAVEPLPPGTALDLDGVADPVRFAPGDSLLAR